MVHTYVYYIVNIVPIVCLFYYISAMIAQYYCIVKVHCILYSVLRL